MNCPTCLDQELKEIVFFNTSVDYCPKCLGLWFEQDELRQAKDEKDKDLNWLDIDLWDKKDKFKVSPSEKICPQDKITLYEVGYGDSDIGVDVCNSCKGVWLDRGEFKKIVEYMRKKGAYEVLDHYYKNIIKEAVEVFKGPETFREELKDFLTLIKLFNYKFATQHPLISMMILSLPR